MSENKQNREEFAASVDWSHEGLPLAADPKAALDLPEGLLALEGLPMPFSGAMGYPVTQDKVLAAAQHIIDHRPEGDENRHFHSQASVMAHASQEYGWLTGTDMRLCAVPNYMHLPKQPDDVKAARAAEADMLIELLNSGLLTTREGSRKLFPDLDTDAMWDKHEAWKKEAGEQQRHETDERIDAIRAERGEAPLSQEEKSWAKTETQRRTSKPNPCLGM